MNKIKKLAFAGATSAILLGAMAAPAFAAPSDCGAGHGAFANVNGNFGFLGEVGGAAGYHDAVGQELAGPNSISSAPGATGYNNSHLCGNPQH